jgi:hypothetical protein
MRAVAFWANHLNPWNDRIKTQVSDFRAFVASDAHQMQIVRCANFEVLTFGGWGHGGRQFYHRSTPVAWLAGNRTFSTKQRVRPMLGFKRFDTAVVTISGIELAEKIKKGQFKTGMLGGTKASMSELWNAALAA